jgi:hypothetical protein
MQTFFKKLVLFLILAILIFALVEVKARSMYQYRSDMYFQFENIESKLQEIEILFLGNSHVAKAINPEYFSRPTINLAYSSQDLYYNYQILKKYIKRLTKLKIVIIGLDYFSFGRDEEYRASHLVKDYFSELFIMPRSGKIFNLIKSFSVYWLHQNTFVEDFFKNKKPNPNKILKMSYVPKPLPQSGILLENGFRFSSGTMSPDEFRQNGKERAKLHMEVYDEKNSRPNIECIYNMIRLCRGKNIKVIFITTPYHKFYFINFDKEFIANFYNKLEMILRKNHQNVFYFDFSRDGNFEDSDFLNSDHLNYVGAKKFSQIVNKKVLPKVEITSIQRN